MLFRSVWIWQTGQQLNISKWRDSKQDGKEYRAEISKNEGLFNSISGSDENAFICEIPGGKITFPPLSLLYVEKLQSCTYVRKTALASYSKILFT